MKRILSVVLAAAMVLGTISFTVFANSIDIADSESLSSAIENAADGDVIKIAPGTYTLTSDLKANDITITGAGIENTIINVDNHFDISGNNVNINDITFKGTGTSQKIESTTVGVVYLTGENASFTNVKITNGGGDTWDSALCISQNGDNITTLTNCTFSDAFRGVMFWTLADELIFNNCIFDPMCYTLNIDAAQADSTVTIRDSKLYGWTSYTNTVKSVDFINCEFAKSASEWSYGYNTIVPYTDTKFEECNFSSDELAFYKGTDGITAEFIDCQKDGEDATVAEFGMFWGSGSDGMVATAGNTAYSSIKEAFDAANNGDTITLLSDAAASEKIMFDNKGNITVDLNNKTLTIASAESVNGIWMDNTSSDVTFKNGTINLNGVEASDSVFRHFGSDMTKTTFDNVSFTGDVEYVCYVFSPQVGSMNFLNSSVNLTTDDDYNYVFSTGNFIIKDTDVNISGFRKGFLNADLSITGGEILIDNCKNGMDNVKGEINSTEITITNSTEYGLGGEGAEYSLTLKNGSVISIENSAEYDISLAGGATITKQDTSKLIYKTASIAVGSAVINPRVMKVVADRDTVTAGDEVNVKIILEGEKLANAGYVLKYDTDKFSYGNDTTGLISFEGYFQNGAVYEPISNIGDYTFKAKAIDYSEIENDITADFTLEEAYASTYDESYANLKVNATKINDSVKFAFDKYELTVKVDGKAVNGDSAKVKYLDAGHTVELETDPALANAITPSITYNGQPYTGTELKAKGEYKITYKADPETYGYAPIDYTFTLTIDAPEFEVEVNLTGGYFSDYVVGKKLVLVHTNVEGVYFKYDGVPMIDVSDRKYGYYNTDTKYDYVHAIIVDYISDTAVLADYKAKITDHAKTTAETAPVLELTSENINNINLSADEVVDLLDVSSIYGVLNQAKLEGAANPFTVSYTTNPEGFIHNMTMALKSDVKANKIIDGEDTAPVVEQAFPIQ